MRFLVDLMLSPELAFWLILQGHDAVHAIDRGLSRDSDAALLAYARKEHRIVITVATLDLNYSKILTLTQAEGPGLILFRGGNYSEQEVIKYLKQVLETMASAELSNSIVIIDKGGIRRRRLPPESNP